MPNDRKDKAASDELLAGDLCFDLADFAGQLAKIPSPPSGERAAAELAVGRMQLLGYDHASLDAAGNAVGIIDGRDRSKAILLTSPLAAAAPRSPLRSRPPELSLHLDRFDARGGLAAQIYAGASLKQSRSPLACSIVVGCVVSGTDGWGLGITHLLSETLPARRVKPVAAILGQPTGLNLNLGHDGWLEIDVRLDGVHLLRLRDAVLAVVRTFDRDYPRGMYANDGEFIRIAEPEFTSLDNLWRARLKITRRWRNGDVPGHIVSALRRQVRRLVEPFRDVWVEVDIPSVEHRCPHGGVVLAPTLSRPWLTDYRLPGLDAVEAAFTARGCRYHLGQWTLPKLGLSTLGAITSGEFGLPTIGYGPGSDGLVTRADLREAVLGTVLIASVMAAGAPTAVAVRRPSPPEGGAEPGSSSERRLTL